MELFEPLDDDRIVQDVKDFFTYDDLRHPVSYAKIERRVQALVSIGSSNGDVTGVHGKGGDNTYEQRLVNNNEYWRALQVIKQAVRACSDRSAKIMEHRYLKRETIAAVQAAINLSGTKSYYAADRYARYEFADAVCSIAAQANISEDVIPNFLGAKV